MDKALELFSNFFVSWIFGVAEKSLAGGTVGESGSLALAAAPQTTKAPVCDIVDHEGIVHRSSQTHHRQGPKNAAVEIPSQSSKDYYQNGNMNIQPEQSQTRKQWLGVLPRFQIEPLVFLEFDALGNGKGVLEARHLSQAFQDRLVVGHVGK